ncbi:MAG: hypothetical protein Q8S73_38170 [Deltaproteobacteria bacterium]|nr:hypothetical protein [Myxococcales bacterium]MDP3219989.1 hypothetical protein [Deltaproteobacteria bacterium]
MHEVSLVHALFDQAAWSCASCGEAVTRGAPLRCASCDGEVRLSAGGALILDRLELEVFDV